MQSTYATGGAASSALVVVGARDEAASLFDTVHGWVVLVPQGIQGHEAVSIISRLGVAWSHVLILGLHQTWETARQLHERMVGSHVAYVDLNQTGSFPGPKSIKNVARLVTNHLMADAQIRATSTLVVPYGREVEAGCYGRQIVGFNVQHISSTVTGGYRKLYLGAAGALAALVAGGSVASALDAYLNPPETLPFEGWLADAAGTSRVARSVGVRLGLVPDGLLLHGYDVRQTTVGYGWGARRHVFRMINQSTGESGEIPLGALRREVLDTLPVAVGSESTAYSAFAFASGDAQSLDGLAIGAYQLAVVDELGENILCEGELAIECSELTLGTIGYRLVKDDAGVQLIVANIL